jgi:adenine-specific DNA methylase
VTQRLIEKWLPIAELGIESVRERTPMTPFPAPNRLHVWWARRPLVASRAAVLASLLPPDADHKKFLHMLGIHGDPVAAKRRIAKATREGVRLGADAYGYPRAFGYTPSGEDLAWFAEARAGFESSQPTVLDPTAGGGSIPFEAMRIGCNVWANDLNPVAALLLKATVDWPIHFGADLIPAFEDLGVLFTTRVKERLAGAFPEEPDAHTRSDGYLWARTIRCPYCDGLVPLSPNWRLASDGIGVKLLPDLHTRKCDFRIVDSVKDQSAGTVTGGDAKCPFSDCERGIDGDEIKRQANAGQLGEQLYAVVVKRPVESRTKSGKKKVTWVRTYRGPRAEDDNSDEVNRRLAEKLPQWLADDIVPREPIPSGLKTNEPLRYGFRTWSDMFSSRQLLCHGTGVEVIRELIGSHGDREISRAALCYLSLALDKLLDWNSRSCTWNPTRQLMAHTFQRHDFALVWSFAEMAPLIEGLGYDWAVQQTGKCIKELVELSRGHVVAAGVVKRTPLPGFEVAGSKNLPAVSVTCMSADALAPIDDGSIDCIVIDPPYYDNVMYAELSDFFYVWLKRTAGRLLPELFTLRLTNKDTEAVANPAKFQGQKGAKALAGREYQQRMAAIFGECRRVLRSDGIMTLMFTHKATGAWDALATGLMEAGFTITASWPVSTEFSGSMHIFEKSAANSTIFLVCRPRAKRRDSDEQVYWEDVEPRVARAVRQRVSDYQGAGLRGVDLYLSCFGPALEEFAKHWPLKRGQPKKIQRPRKGQDGLYAEPVDPYGVTPEDALDAARREVKRWRLEQFVETARQGDLDPLTEWFVLAWDAFKAPEFPYDEGLRLARVVGLDLDQDIVNKVAEKKASDLVLWDSARRVAKGALGPADGSRALLDSLHHVAWRARQRGVQAARDLVEQEGLDREAAFATGLRAILEVLPVSSTFTHIQGEKGLVAEAASDFDALEHLRRLVFSDRVPQPQQLKFWEEQA